MIQVIGGQITWGNLDSAKAIAKTDSKTSLSWSEYSWANSPYCLMKAMSTRSSRSLLRISSQRCCTIAIVGIDGCGKSTVSNSLAKGLSFGRRVFCIGNHLLCYRHGKLESPPFLLSDLLRQALGRFAKSARSLRHYEIPKLAELLLRDRLIRKIEKRYSPEPIVLDGSPLINLGAWTTLYKADLDENAIGIALKVINGRDISASEQISIRNKLPELFILRSLGLAHMQLPQAALFLDVAPAVCVERIRRRGGALQVHETEERLTDLRRGYVVCCSALRKNFGLRIAVVRGNGDRESAAKAANDLASELL